MNERLLLTACGLFLGLVGRRPAGAGDYHQGAELRCSVCHTMHYSENGGAPEGAGVAGPYPYLLKNSADLLCLTCHDGANGADDAAPDVLMAASYESPSLKRSAGAFTAAVGTATDQGHNLSVPGDTAPGSDPPQSFPAGLNCVACHDPHGNVNYRNLCADVGGRTGVVVSYVNTTYNGTSALLQTALSPTSVQYSTSNVQVRGDSTTDGLGQWCKSCHTVVHGVGGDAATVGGPEPATPWLRHPTSGVTLAAAVTNGHVDPDHWFGTLASRVRVVSPGNVIPGTAGTSDNRVFCGTCHKAHGSNHRFALICDDDSTPDLEDGTTARSLCQQCHYK